MIVAISWVSFWLQADASPPRIMLGTSTMLTFITLASAQGKTLPKVSYIKLSEVWFLGCCLFIFASLVEFAFVNTIWRRKKNIELKKVICIWRERNFWHCINVWFGPSNRWTAVTFWNRHWHRNQPAKKLTPAPAYRSRVRARASKGAIRTKAALDSTISCRFMWVDWISRTLLRDDVLIFFLKPLFWAGFHWQKGHTNHHDHPEHGRFDPRKWE